jgi:hypothetical protein
MALAHARPHAHVRAFCPAHAWEPEFSSWAGTGLTSVRVLVQYSRLFPLLLNRCIATGTPRLDQAQARKKTGFSLRSILRFKFCLRKQVILLI